MIDVMMHAVEISVSIGKHEKDERDEMCACIACSYTLQQRLDVRLTWVMLDSSRRLNW